jgi:aconitase B
MIMYQKVARTSYMKNVVFRASGCNLCMGNQEKSSQGDTVTSTRLFKEELLRILKVKGRIFTSHTCCSFIYNLR